VKTPSSHSQVIGKEEGLIMLFFPSQKSVEVFRGHGLPFIRDKGLPHCPCYMLHCTRRVGELCGENPGW
jgi:hypothetical protein